MEVETIRFGILLCQTNFGLNNLGLIPLIKAHNKFSKLVKQNLKGKKLLEKKPLEKTIKRLVCRWLKRNFCV